VEVTGFHKSNNDVRNQLQQQEPTSCYHQCTRCAIIFHCDRVLYRHRQLGIGNQCENAFHYGKCNTCEGAKFRR
jgi:hypothetical protein